MASDLHTVEIVQLTGEPHPRIRFTCHGDRTAACHNYPACDCETWTESHEHPFVEHEQCWLQGWFDADNVSPSSDTLDDGDYTAGMCGPIDASFEGEYVEWEFVTTPEVGATDTGNWGTPVVSANQLALEVSDGE